MQKCELKKENSTTEMKYWKPLVIFYILFKIMLFFHFTDAKHFPAARNWTAW